MVLVAFFLSYYIEISCRKRAGKMQRQSTAFLLEAQSIRHIPASLERKTNKHQIKRKI